MSTTAAMPDWTAIEHSARRHSVRAAAAILAVSLLYCYGYALLAGTPANLTVSLGWSLADWGMWLLLAPLTARFALASLRTGMPTRQAWARTAYAAGACALTAVLARAAIEYGVGTGSLAFVLFKRAPLYLLMAYGAAAGAFWLARPRVTVEIEVPVEVPVRVEVPVQVGVPAPAAALPLPAGLLVQSARGEHRLPLAAIDYIEACGNYLEARAGGANYLMRLTMKALEPQLAHSAMLRCHRSYFVNRDRISRLDYRDSGNHLLVLHDGTSIPVSKAYRDRVRAALGMALEAA